MAVNSFISAHIKLWYWYISSSLLLCHILSLNPCLTKRTQLYAGTCNEATPCGLKSKNSVSKLKLKKLGVVSLSYPPLLTSLVLYCVLQIRIYLDLRNMFEEVRVADQSWSSSRKESCHHRRDCFVHEYGIFTPTRHVFASSTHACCRLTMRLPIRCC